jgi:EMC6
VRLRHLMCRSHEDISIILTCHHLPAMAHTNTCSLLQAASACHWCSTQTAVSVLLCSRIFASLIAGLALGVVGYAGWSGFLWYFLAHALVMVLLFFKCMPACERGCRVDQLLIELAHYCMSSEVHALRCQCTVHLSFRAACHPGGGVAQT